MTQKWIGAICVMAACSACGFLTAAAHKREEAALRQLIQIIVRMENELTCRVTPLPQLLRSTADGLLAPVMLAAAEKMEQQILPDAACCLGVVLESDRSLPPKTRKLLQLLGASLGRFDLDGQLRELACVNGECQRVLSEHCENQDKRLRSFRAMGVCVGAVLAILLL